MKKLCMKRLCALLAACLLLCAAALAEEAGAAVIEPEDARVVAEAADAAVTEGEADLDDVTDADVPEGEADLDDVTDADVPEGEADPDEAADADVPEGEADPDEAADADVPEGEVDLDAANDGDPPDPDAGDARREYVSAVGADMDSDARFAGYVRRLFGIDGGALYEARNVGGDLTGAPKALYDMLRRFAAEVAAGERASTVFVWSLNDGSLSFEDIHKVIDCLIADCPYEMYWHNNYHSITFDKFNNSAIISMGVGSGYSGGDYCTVDPSAVRRASEAAENARAIVERYADSPDYNKLAGYRDEICSAVSYNESAANRELDAGETDPWQLVWVFDGDPSTNVVCEGYARAFQYLCDMTRFSGGAMCYCVTGTVNGGSHKWNIVRMPNGKNYLVDVTQCDQESTGTFDWMFMKAPDAGGGVAEGYDFTVRNGSRTMRCQYRYDEDTRRIYQTSDLTLSASGYAADAGLSGQDSADVDIDELYTDEGQGAAQGTPAPADSGASAAGIQIIPMSGNARATVSVGTLYRIEPAGQQGRQFKSSNRRVVRVTGGGLVTPARAGRARITFKVGKKRRTLTLKIVDPTVPSWVSLNPSGTVAVRRGERMLLTPGIPEGTRTGFKWKSSNRRVAAVNKYGEVTFKRPGRATVTVTAKRGKKKARVTFVVGE